MSLEQLVNLISRDHLAVSSEWVVFNSVYKWLDHDQNRQVHLDQIMSHVRIPLMETKNLLQLLDIPLIKNSPYCNQLIRHVIQTRKNNNSIRYDLLPNNNRPRVALGLPRVKQLFKF